MVSPYLWYAIIALGVVFVALLITFVVKFAIMLCRALWHGNPWQNLITILTLGWLMTPTDDGDSGGE